MFSTLNRGRCYRDKVRVTRKEKREALSNYKLCSELLKIIRRFMPGLVPLLKGTKDSRHQSYVAYKNYVILFLRILATILRLGSMRRITEELNNVNCMENVRKILGLKTLDEFPHYSTINDYLEKLDTAELEEIIPKLVDRLIRMRSFEDSRVRNKYWQVLVDGSQLFSFSEPHCANCLTREYKDKDGNIIRTEYYHMVLEAKLVLNGNLVFSIATEFIENPLPSPEKQDCETKAFYRLAEKLKSHFPRLPICLSGDSLYASDPVFNLCRRYGWVFIIRFKDGSIPTVAEDFNQLKTMESGQHLIKSEAGVIKEYRFVTGIQYNTHSLNMVECVQSDRTYPFVFVTCLPISRRNCEQTVLDGRRRWKIENEGFNAQKNHGAALCHMFSKNYTAMKNHYLLIQIGHMLAQLLEAVLRNEVKLSASGFFEELKLSLKTESLTDADLEHENRRRYRLT